MAKIMTTTTLVTTSLRRGMIPADQSTFTCCEVIDIMNEEMGIHILPMVLRAHEEYYVVDTDVCIVACQVRYKIPYRAVGNKLRDVSFVDSGGNQYEMTRLTLEERAAYQGNYTTDQLIPFYIENDNVVLMSKRTTGKLRMSYYLRPNDLVKTARAGEITVAPVVGCCTTVFTVCSFPAHFTDCISYDFIQGSSPNKIIAFDIGCATVCSTAKTLTFNNSDLTQVDLFSSSTKAITFAVGDYIMKQEETIIPQLPSELHPILAQRTAIKMLEALGDTEGMRNAQQELERMEYNAMTLIDNRVEGAPQKVHNRKSILKQSLSNRLFRRRGI